MAWKPLRARAGRSGLPRSKGCPDPIKKGGKISSEGTRTALRTSSSTEISRKLLRAAGLTIRADDFRAVAQDVLYHGKLQHLAQHLFLVCAQRLALVPRD